MNFAMFKIMDQMRKTLFKSYWTMQKNRYCNEPITSHCVNCRHYEAICKEDDRLKNMIREAEKSFESLNKIVA